MFKYIKEKTRFSFGATSAIITNMGLITGLDMSAHPKVSIISGILVIALADNVADSFGIHIYQESECLNPREIWISTLTNFLTRVLVSSVFILLILFLPLRTAVACSIIYGLSLLAFMSYSIARNEKVNPYRAAAEHLAVAVAVIIASNYVGRWLLCRF